MGFLTFEASCLQWCVKSMTNPRPLARFLDRAFKLTHPLTPQGITPPETQSISLKTDAAPLVFCTSSTLSFL